MHGREDLGIGVEDLTDGPISGTIVSDDPGQSFIAGLETQHGFRFPTHPCSPSWSLNNHEDKDASFLCKASRPQIGKILSATETKEDTDYNTDNENLIMHACPLFLKLLRECADCGWNGIDLLCRFSSNEAVRGVDDQWLQWLIRRSLVTPVRKEQLVLSCGNERIAPCRCMDTIRLITRSKQRPVEVGLQARFCK